MSISLFDFRDAVNRTPRYLAEEIVWWLRTHPKQGWSETELWMYLGFKDIQESLSGILELVSQNRVDILKRNGYLFVRLKSYKI